MKRWWLKRVSVDGHTEGGNFPPRASHFYIAEARKVPGLNGGRQQVCACFAPPANRREWGESGTSGHSGLAEAPRDAKQTPPATLGASRWRPTDRPTDPYTCSAWPLVAARRFWMKWGETYRDLFGATHGQSPSACIVVEPNQTSALGVSPPWKLRASVPAGRFLRPR